LSAITIIFASLYQGLFTHFLAAVVLETALTIPQRLADFFALFNVQGLRSP
jgi:hypothetical protein